MTTNIERMTQKELTDTIAKCSARLNSFKDEDMVQLKVAIPKSIKDLCQTICDKKQFVISITLSGSVLVNIGNGGDLYIDDEHDWTNDIEYEVKNKPVIAKAIALREKLMKEVDIFLKKNKQFDKNTVNDYIDELCGEEY